MGFAKTIRPTVAGAMRRGRLHRLLGRHRHRSITWVWGPPGAGKTTLVSSFVSARRLKGLWYQVDAGDADIATFFYFLGQAAPRRRTPMPLLTPEYRAGLDLFARRFFRELYRRFNTPFAFVLDNYHEAPAEALLHDVLRAAAEELPRGGRLIIISRTEPPPSLARLRLHQSLDVVDWAHLRLTLAEAESLARRMRQRRAATVRALYESSDGWMAGLILLLNQCAEDERSQSRRHGSPQLLFDYFAAEIFNRTDPETRDVLRQTSLLPVVHPTMAVELTGRRRAADVIELLHRASYFTNKRPGMNGAYEYHPLFRQFLMAEARRAYSSPRLAALRSRAAHLVEQAGDLAAAVELLADAENWEAVAQLICRHAPSLLAQGRVHTIEQWLARMPEEAFTETAWLLCWRGVCQLGRGHDSCRRDCEQALAAFRRDRDTDGMLLSWAIVVMSHLMEGWLEPLDDWIPRLAELQSESSHPAAPQIEARVATTMLIAIAFRQPTHPNGAQWAQRALDLTRAESDLGLRCLAASGWFLYHWMRGETATASLVVDEMRTLSRRRDVPSVVSLQAAIPVIWYELFHGSPDCRQTVADIREHARATGLRHALLTTALAYGAFSALSDGQHEVASAWIRELERESPNLGPAYAFAYYGLIAVEALARNDVERASAYVDKLARRGYTAGNPVEEVFAHTVTAYVCSRRGEDETASAHAARALEVALAQGLRFAEWWARIAAAHVSFASGAEGEGLQALALAMKIGKTCGYVNSQVWVPTIMMPLLARALDAGIEVEYVRDLIRRRRLVCDPPPLDIEAWPWPIKIVTLGRFAVMKDDRPLRSGGKVQRKPLALLTMLAAHGAAGVHEQRVQDALWPDADGDAARRALTTAVFRLRRLLGNETAVVRRDGRIGLSAARCWVDVWAMERLLERAERANTRGDPEGGAQLAERAAALYGGPVVGPNDDDMPTDPRSDRLRRRLIRQLVTAGRRYETTGQWHRAENVFEAALKLDPSDEGVRASLTLAYRRLGRPAV